MCKFSILFAYLLTMPALLFAADHGRNYRDLAAEIEAIQGGTVAATSQLHSLAIEEYAARGYLLYYRAQAKLQEAERYPLGQRLKLLRAAHNDLRQAMHARHHKKECSELMGKVHEALAIETLSLELDFEALETIDRLPRAKLESPEWILRYGLALYRTKQKTAFGRLALRYLEYFRDEKLLRKTLHIEAPWRESVTKMLAARSTPRPARTVKRRRKAFTRSQLLERPRKFLSSFSKSKYLDLDQSFAIARALYFEARKNPTSRYQNYVKIFEHKRLNFSPDYLKSLIYRHWKRGELKVAAKLARHYTKEFSGSPEIPQLLYDYARILEDQGHFAKAEQSFARLADLTDKETLLDYALFRKAWTRYLQKKKPQKALKAFSEYLKQYPEGKYASTALYYKVKLSEKLGKKPSPQSISPEIHNFIADNPLSFYSVKYLVEHRIGTNAFLSLLGSLHGPLATPDFSLNIAEISRLRTFYELRALRLFADARQLMEAIPFNASNREYMFYLTSAYTSIDDLFHRTIFLTKIAKAFPEIRNKVRWGQLFPKHLLPLIAKAKEYLNSKIDKWFVLSIIRQESAFDKEAVSSAKAYGLMQLIASTASESARRAKLKNYKLNNPEHNVILGIQTVSDLLRRYNGRIDYALSAYNAGPGVTNRWIARRKHLGPLEFVESIPFQETRSYIKNVLRNYVIYKMLYGSRKRDLAVSFKFASNDFT